MTDDSITFESAIFQNFGKNLALLSTRCARLHSDEKTWSVCFMCTASFIVYQNYFEDPYGGGGVNFYKRIRK